jgi:hypothetical protein
MNFLFLVTFSIWLRRRNSYKNTNVYEGYLSVSTLYNWDITSWDRRNGDLYLTIDHNQYVLRPAKSTQVFHGFSTSKSECSDGSQDSKVATTYFSCSPPDLNFLDPYFIFMYMHYNHCHRATARLQLNILLLLLLLLLLMTSHQRIRGIY